VAEEVKQEMPVKPEYSPAAQEIMVNLVQAAEMVAKEVMNQEGVAEMPALMPDQ